MAKTYDTYKDSGIAWIGEIPSEWEVLHIKHALLWKSEKGHGNSQVLSLYRDLGIVPKDSRDDNHNVTSENTDEYKFVCKGDFVVNKMKAWQGSMALSNFEGIVSPAYYVFSFKNENIHKQYFHHLLRNESYLPEYRRLSTGLRVGQWDLGYEDFKEIPFLLPSLSDQQSIASFLDTKCGEIDALISLQEESISELQAYKQSVITEAVTKGLDPHAKMKDSGVEWIGEIPEHWEVDKIFRVFKNIGSGTTPKATEDNNFKGDINWVQSGDINGGVLHSCKNKISQDVLHKYSSLKVYKAPFIIVAMYGASVGNISVSKIDGCVNQACCVMSNSNHYLDYLFYTIKSAKDYLIYRAEGGGQPNISQDKLKNLWLPCPPLHEQHSIATYLDEKTSQIDSLISLKQEKIEELKDYKKSIIYEYVTGKKRV